MDGEYNLEDICIGVPCIIGANGVESIIDIKLSNSEENLLNESAIRVKEMNAALLNLFEENNYFINIYMSCQFIGLVIYCAS